MIEVDAAFTTAIAANTLKMAELYIVELSNGVTYYYTSHSENIAWNSPAQVYTAIPIQRGSIGSKINLEANVVDITLANITGNLFNVVQNNVLDSCKITIKRICWNEAYSAGMEFICFKGIADIEFDRKVLILHCRSILDILNVQVPKNIYQESCNNRLFDANCALIKSTFKHSLITTSAATDNFTVNKTSLSHDVTYWTLGEIEIQSGLNDGCRRMIRTSTTNSIIVAVAFPNIVANNVTFDLYPGCDKRGETCNGTFSNGVYFNGYAYIPKVEDVLF